jgi:nucleoside-diphosphate-sugar epimerase
MKFLVTGGLGFIGHNVVQLLEKFNHEVRIIDNQTNYGIVPQAEIDCLIQERLSRIKTRDITIASIEQPFDPAVFKDIDVVIHLASFPRQKVVNANPQWGSRTMSEGLLNLLELSVTHHVRKFVYISSSMVYGNFTDSSFDGTDEYHPCQPLGQYGIMKLAGEWLVKDYTRRHNIAHTIIRPSAVYGPLDVEDRVVSKFLLTAMRGGTIQVNGPKESLDFTFVSDAANGIASAAMSEYTDNMIYNITRGEAHTLLEAAELAVKIAGQGTIKVNERDNEFPSRGQLNINRARTDFEYRPEVNIEEGFKEYYDWLIDHPIYWTQKAV